MSISKESNLYTPWRVKLLFQKCATGSRWYRGNFSLGFIVDSHPRFVNFVIGLILIEVGIGFTREINYDDSSRD